MAASHHHRPRSHSASTSPLPGRVPLEDSWRVATKRAHPHQHQQRALNDHEFSPQNLKWDVEVWRRGKRARRSMDYMSSEDHSPLRDHSRSLSNGATSQLLPAFPCSSAEFNLFPNRKRRKDPSRPSSPSSPSPVSSTAAKTTRRMASAGSHSIDNISTDSATHGGSSFTFTADLNLPDESDVSRLRSTAFWELRRSVAESGESLVRRMRDYEHTRSRASAYRSRGRDSRRGSDKTKMSPPSASSAAVTGPYTQSEDRDLDDDVLILGEQTAPSGGCARKKRALSLGLLDAPPSSLFRFSDSAMCSPTSAIHDTASTPSSFPSDNDEDEDDEGCFSRRRPRRAMPPHPPSVSASMSSGYTPALSHTYSTSSNSSLVSLPLPPPISAPGATRPPLALFQGSTLQPHTHQHQHQHRPPLPASRAEKAIAALSLAMANGAGGLNDYHALLAIQGLSQDCGVSPDVGELWH